MSEDDQFDYMDTLDYCDDNGNYNIGIVLNILGDMGFRVNSPPEYNRKWTPEYPGQNLDLDWDSIRGDMDRPRFLGMVLLKGRRGGHYTAVSSTVSACDDLTYIDSIQKQWKCATKDDMIRLLKSKTGNVQTAISVFTTRHSIQCNACDKLE